MAKKKKKKKKKKRALKRKSSKSGKARCSHTLSSGRKCKKYAVVGTKCDMHAEKLSGSLKSELAKFVKARLPRRKKRSKKRRRNPARVKRCSSKTAKGTRCKNKRSGRSSCCGVHKRKRTRRRKR
jgi:hypothetical protein